MPKYQILVDVRSVSGTQLWEVEADSPEDALAKYNDGDGDVVHEEIEVTSLEDAILSNVSEAGGTPNVHRAATAHVSQPIDSRNCK